MFKLIPFVTSSWGRPLNRQRDFFFTIYEIRHALCESQSFLEIHFSTRFSPFPVWYIQFPRMKNCWLIHFHPLLCPKLFSSRKRIQISWWLHNDRFRIVYSKPTGNLAACLPRSTFRSPKTHANSTLVLLKPYNAFQQPTTTTTLVMGGRYITVAALFVELASSETCKPSRKEEPDIPLLFACIMRRRWRGCNCPPRYYVLLWASIY